MIDCKIKINNERHSREVQEYPFERGAKWCNKGNDIFVPSLDSIGYLYVKNNMVEWDNIGSDEYFKSSTLPELIIQESKCHLIIVDGRKIELGEKEYQALVDSLKILKEALV